jgi:hypothetical protein
MICFWKIISKSQAYLNVRHYYKEYLTKVMELKKIKFIFLICCRHFYIQTIRDYIIIFLKPNNEKCSVPISKGFQCNGTFELLYSVTGLIDLFDCHW